MTNEEAIEFALNSYVKAFEAGNEEMIDHYFSADLEFRNHSVAKNFSLNEIKLSALKAHQKYQNLKSAIKEVVVEGNRIAFRAEQCAFFVPDNEHVNINVMNLYTIINNKVKAWHLWFSQHTNEISHHG